jgi:Putative beta barrel porin-7 (BBP7)
MRSGFACLIAMASASLSLAQTPQAAVPPPITVSAAPAPSASGDVLAGACCQPGSRLWASSEYLLWWIKEAPLPASLVTTGPVSGNPGALNAGGVPLFGSQMPFNDLSGVRLTIGGWLDSSGTIGLEGSGFIVPKQTRTFAASSDPTGNPVIAFRYQDPPVNGVPPEDAFQAAIPGMFAGGVKVISSSLLGGAEANGVANLGSYGSLRLQALAGFRYLDLEEDLTLDFTQRALPGSTVPFLGGMFPAPDTVESLDTFRTRTQFYGGQLGIRGEYGFGSLFVTGSAKIALGDSHEVVTILGSSTLNIPGVAPQTVSGGQFASTTNDGRYTRDDFAVVPEVELDIGYQVSQSLRVFVGYNFLYWSRVVRPGNQVDLVVNDLFNPVNPGFGSTAMGTAPFPRAYFNTSDFWAQGVTLGVEFRF